MNETHSEIGQTGMSAPLSLPRVGSLLLYTLTGANARIAMSESTFGRHLREGDVRALLVTHAPTVHGNGEAVTISGEVLTGRGVLLPVDGVPLVREPTPGAAHWPAQDDRGDLTAQLRAAREEVARLREVVNERDALRSIKRTLEALVGRQGEMLNAIRATLGA